MGSALILRSLATIDPKSLRAPPLMSYRAQATHVIGELIWGRADAAGAGDHGLVGIAITCVNTGSRERLARGARAAASAEIRLRGELHFSLCRGGGRVGSLIINYLMQSDVLGLGQKAAGEHVPLYWGGAMVGRFIGSYLLRLFSPGKVLAVAAAEVITLLFTSSHTTGVVSGWSLLSIGLCNSIMFPTIFSLASEGSVALRLSLRHHRRGDRRRRRDPAADRPCGGCVQPENGAHCPGDLPNGDPGVRDLLPTAGGHSRAG